MIGRWRQSPFGSFVDVMIEAPDGTRTLVAPDADIARFVAATYEFDTVTVTTLTSERNERSLRVRGRGLVADVVVGRRPPLGVLLHVVPRRLAATVLWAALADPVVRVTMAGVRTRGAAGQRCEWYGAYDLHRLTSATAVWQDEDLGGIADVDPPVRFGFGSTPRRPSLVAVTTTVEHVGRRSPAPVLTDVEPE